jgi:uncharacterized repeat protein (TIGR01451 family)
LLKIHILNDVVSANLLKNIEIFIFTLLLTCNVTLLRAAPTPAGTLISNQAKLSYTVDGIAQTPVTTNIATFTVLEIVNVSLIWQDAGQVHVNTPQVNAPLTFVLTNTGNGTQSYRLQRDNTVVGDQFDPNNGSAGAVFIENGLEPGFQATGPNADTLYIPGQGTPPVLAGASLTVYVSSDIPSALAIGNTGRVNLQVVSRTLGLAGSPPGSTHPNITEAGQTATSVVVTGLTQGQAVSQGAYVVDGAVVTIKKSILYPTDANALIPGTELKYRLLVEVQGIGSVDNLIVNDPLPAQLNYLANSITVGTVAKTDALDADNAQFVNNTVSVNLGNITAPATYVIEFRATLK